MGNQNKSSDTVIHASRLTYRYESEPVFNDVDFSIQKGDFVAIIGANGSGKSTLMRLLLGELDLQHGEIELFGEKASSFQDWPKIGYVPQNSSAKYVNFPATSLEVVKANLYSKTGLFRLPNKKDRNTALDALDEVQMAPYAKRMLSELSGGQLQRVMLARVLVSEPDLLVLDEPTNGVDASTVDLLYKRLKELNESYNMTIVMVTHDLVRAADYVSRVLCLEEGSMVELSQEEIQNEIKHRHTHPEIEEPVLV